MTGQTERLESSSRWWDRDGALLFPYSEVGRTPDLLIYAVTPQLPAHGTFWTGSITLDDGEAIRISTLSIVESTAQRTSRPSMTSGG